MNKKSTRNALAMSVLSLLLCLSMLVSTTFAWFTDSVSSQVNQITAGNLDVNLQYWADLDADGTKEWTDVAGSAALFDPNAKWEPGYTQVVYLKVSNDGSLDLKYAFLLNIFQEIAGKTKQGADIVLSEHLRFGIARNVAADAFGTNRAAAIAAVTEPTKLQSAAYEDTLASGDSETLAIVVWMPTSVGNEANHDGFHIPSIQLGVKLVAAQLTSESDSFGSSYDTEAIYPNYNSGMLDPNGSAVVMDLNDEEDEEKLGTMTIPADALADPTKKPAASIDKAEDPYPNITVQTGHTAQTFHISVTNLKEDNTVPVKLELFIGKGMDPATVVLYHYDDPIPASYNPTSGYVTFETTDFSPFTAVFDPDSTVPVGSAGPLPVAVVTQAPEHVGVDLPWKSFGGFEPTPGLDNQLEAAYVFACQDTSSEAMESAYANWYCDFYVMLDRDLQENQILLGGNYGSFGWIGFHNGDVTLGANQEIPLLGSVTQNPWTYAQVASAVGEFTCGVGDVGDALSGATFTVMLRLTNPNDTSEYYNVSTITFTFE